MKPGLIERIIDKAVAIQQIPAPTFGEQRRAAFVYEQFQAEGLADVSVDGIGNVYARLCGQGSVPPVVVSAHLDTVFSVDTTLDIRREADRIYGPGIGDNSLGIAGLFGLLWCVRDESLRRRAGTGVEPQEAGDIWLVANVGEEGLGNLRGMTAVVDRFGGDVCAYIVVEGMALGQVYHRGLSVKRYRISVHTPGGHAWVDYGQPSAIHELAALIARILSLPIPSQPRTSLNVGVITGGTTVNTIAAGAECLLDLRSEAPDELARLAAGVEALVRAGERTDVEFAFEVVGQRPGGALPRDHPLVRTAERCLEARGIQPLLNIGSTDANLPLSRGLPAVTIGLTGGGGAHTAGEFIYTQPLEQGMAQLLELVSRLRRRGALRD